jgi:hypothetical protein
LKKLTKNQTLAIEVCVSAVSLAIVGYLVFWPKSTAATPAPAPTPAPPAITPGGGVDIGSVNASLVTNHRYDLTITDPTTVQGLQLAPGGATAATIQPGFDRIFGSGKLVIANVVNKPTSIDIIFDYRGAPTLAVNAATFQIPGGTLTDLGASP